MAFAIKDQSGAWTEITGAFVAYGVGPENFERVELEDGSIVNLRSEGRDNISVPAGWPEAVTQEEREAFGVYPITETTGYPEDVLVTGTRLVDDNNRPRREWVTRAFTVDEIRSKRLIQLDQHYEATLAGGFKFTHGGATETLQVRDQDKANWLGLKDSCNDAIAGGMGATICPIPIRTLTNETVRLTFAEIAEILRDMRTWMSQCMAIRWEKKDALEAATTRAQVNAVSVDTGWPV